MTVLNKLGVSTELGTDTAWTFESHGPEYGNKILHELGWDGRAPVLVVCPINPFWWPVKASVTKYLAYAVTGAFKDSHYRTIYFHNSGPSVTQAYDHYLTAMSKAVDAFRKEQRVFTMLVAMEALDMRACRRMSDQLGGVPVLSSLDYDMYQLVSILRSCHLMVSSRYHGIVCAMPALVASAGVTMDERIRNLMRERGHDHLLLDVDDRELEGKLLAMMRTLLNERESVRDGIGRTVAKNLKVMARMGVYFEQHVQRRFPEFPTRTGILSWEDYLPPLSPHVRKLVETYEVSTKAHGHRA
jgi:polysaccharide pyruvyl transferase WcaK-like protein